MARAKWHVGRHADDCPTRDTNPERNGVKHRSPCDDLPDHITVAPAPSGQGDPLTDMFKAFQDFMANGGEAVADEDSGPKAPARGRGRGQNAAPQPEAEAKPKPKPESKVIPLGDEDSQPNGAWFKALLDGLTAYGFVVTLAKLNKNYGRNEFAEPSAYEAGNQIIHNNSPWQSHGESLGEAKVGQEYETFCWPRQKNLYDVLAELDGWERSLLKDIN